MFRRRRFHLALPSRNLLLGESTLLMGVLNVTPDSFSDGGRYLDPQAALDHALAMERAGAAIIDVGGESTRPGSRGITVEEELSRVLPVLEKLRGRLKVPVSIDTSKYEVAEAAAANGAEILNDVTALRRDPRLAGLVSSRKMGLVLMHMRGEPHSMQKKPFAKDVVREVISGLRRDVAVARKAGVAPRRIVLDPGIGFGKSVAQNLQLLARLPELAKLGFPILVGTSRKSFLAVVSGRPAEKGASQDRVWATAATVAAAILQGAHMVRVHDVEEMAGLARVADAVASAAFNRRGKLR